MRQNFSSILNLFLDEYLCFVYSQVLKIIVFIVCTQCHFNVIINVDVYDVYKFYYFTKLGERET